MKPHDKITNPASARLTSRLAVIGGFVIAMAVLPPQNLGAQVNLNQRSLANSTSITATAAFSPAAHIQVEHGLIIELPEQGSADPEIQSIVKKVFVKFVGGFKNESVVVSCVVEQKSAYKKNGDFDDCHGEGNDDFNRIVMAGQTFTSRLDLNGTSKRDDVVVSIDFSYI